METSATVRIDGEEHEASQKLARAVERMQRRLDRADAVLRDVERELKEYRRWEAVGFQPDGLRVGGRS